MTTRKALLIGAPGGRTTKFLPGVSSDIDGLKKFLMSVNGGAWYEDEIIVLEDAEIDELRIAKHSMDADFTLTLFSGHGFVNSRSNNCLTLSDGNHFYDTELLNSSFKQVVLIDACRKTMPHRIAGPPGIGAPYFDFDGKTAEKLYTARLAYNRLIDNSEEGKVILHSTGYDTFARETESGGVFLQTFLNIGRNIPIRGWINSYSITDARNLTFASLRNRGYPQIPTITFSEGNIDMPFAISLPRQERTYDRAIQQESRPNYAGLFFTIGLIGLIAAIMDN